MAGTSLPPPRRHGRLVARLIVLAGFFFAFGFALVPLYDVFCRMTGLNGKTDAQPATMERAVPDSTRSIQVEFLAHADSRMPWEFSGETVRLSVRPGDVKQVNYRVFNPTERTMVGQAVP